MLDIRITQTIRGNTLKVHRCDDKPRIYALKGPSGIGKTTILNIIAGLTRPEDGYIKINGRVLTDVKHGIQVKIQQRNIAYLFQDYQLFPNMTVAQNITFMSQYSTHISELFAQLNIEHLKDQFPRRLSGGEAQRVALARALSTKPDLILLDEPFSSLDDNTKEESIALVKQIFKLWQIPIIFVTHSNYEAETLADEMIKLNHDPACTDI
ncbi:ATP-binding cassette domain-containing protein [Staphylococcus sp. ACRSN]|uniref:ATP-binding cassette domain-containing protein n=1 Tax=Staphylococcus sp. ACRSN TaxID=2918214 RepID=UPI001EF3B2E2|nr:ATP-binding cassette domain-containing protein [Staphylococcus sp. ACRSN]MCG7338262.1 ATP-binding cassette domain-containing protein [Staphylococcus sp. ACRSN]